MWKKLVGKGENCPEESLSRIHYWLAAALIAVLVSLIIYGAITRVDYMLNSIFGS